MKLKLSLPRLRMNPIIVKEIRSRMRGPRAFITLTIMLLVMGAILAAILQIILATSRYNTVLSPQIGQSMFAALSFLILFMVCAITPAVTAGAISGEKEKQTYEMLMATPLSPTRILWGKLISAMSYVLLLLFASVPLASLVFLFGGVAPKDMIKSLAILMVVALMLGVLGLFMSALFGRTGRATVASFITVVVLMVGPMFVAILVGVLRSAEPPRWILAPSPISALAGALAPSMNSGGGFEIFWVLSGLWNMLGSPVSQTEIPRPIYHYSLPLYLGLSLLMFMLTTRLVQPSLRWRLRRKEVITGLAALMLFAAIVAAVFLSTASRYEWALRGKSLEPTPAPLMVDPNMPFRGGVAEKSVVIQAEPVGGLSGTSTPMAAYPPAGVVNLTAIPDLDMETQVDIYAAVVRQMYEVDHTFGNQAPNFPVLYILQHTDDGVGDPNIEQTAPVELGEKLRAGIASRLSDLPTNLQWASSLNDVPKEPKTGEVIGRGAAITLGNLHLQDDGTVQVSASLYFASLGASGKTYILAFQDGAWIITGTTGVEWIS
jgi:ABC-2 type transport system permease protein